MSERDADDGEDFVNARHQILHYAAIARGIVAELPTDDAVILDHGCGEALSAERVAAHSATLYLCDDDPSLRARLASRFQGNSRIVVISPHAIETLPDHSVDLVIAQGLDRTSTETLDALLGLWRSKLKDDGRLIITGLPSEGVGRGEEMLSLARFAWSGGFLGAACLHLLRRLARGHEDPNESLTRWGEAEVIALLRDRNFTGRRRSPGLGYDPTRMTFLATPA